MTAYEFGLGEYRMRDGRTAWVKFRLPGDPPFPWVGYYLDDCGVAKCEMWQRDGRNASSGSCECDLMPPKLTCEQAYRQMVQEKGWINGVDWRGFLPWDVWEAAWTAALENQEDSP